MPATPEKWKKYQDSKPPEWRVWRSMIGRCTLTKHPWYHCYGGKGIKVWDRWREHGKGFKNFMEDVGERPSPEHDLDRIDSDKDYCLENCRWLHRSKNRATNIKEKEDEIPF